VTLVSCGVHTEHRHVPTTLLPLPGEYTDTESGLQYLRARYFDPATGQFLTRDPLEPITGTPYAYANNGPINTVDPSGLWGVRLGPIKVGDDGCVLGTNPNGSCLGSSALPDYVAVDVSGYVPVTPIGAGPGGGFSFTLTRSGQVYRGLHGGVGIGGGVSARGGYMLPEYKGQGRASRCRIDNFVKGWSGTVNFDFPGYSQGATANGNGVAAEFGAATGIGTSINVAHNWERFDLGEGW
jgi:RHS repeat-associated protein